ncbi:MAG TPA: flavodoxin domain-containing protein [Candidatus Limiplasma sp.]|nr:flavodoxin domain-containing protein [Candidatus Limiplasma sp.]
MPKTAILYRSPHHGNTKKLINAIAKAHADVTLVKAGEDSFDPSRFDVIGFASGVYAGRLHRSVHKALNELGGDGRKGFVIYTCGDTAGEKYGKRFLDALAEKGFTPCGFYWCLGHDSFGPLRLVGGIHKGRPNADDIQGAVDFYDGMIC